MSVLDVLLGRPLSTFEEEGQRIGLLDDGLVLRSNPQHAGAKIESTSSTSFTKTADVASVDGAVYFVLTHPDGFQTLGNVGSPDGAELWKSDANGPSLDGGRNPDTRGSPSYSRRDHWAGGRGGLRTRR